MTRDCGGHLQGSADVICRCHLGRGGASCDVRLQAWCTARLARTPGRDPLAIIAMGFRISANFLGA